MTVLDTDILGDWQRDKVNRILSHIDMVLDYDTNTGTAPSNGNYVRGSISGAIGKIIAGTDLGGTSATGSLTLTDVIGRFEDNEALVVLDELPFDNVQTGKTVSKGDLLTGPTTETFTVRAIELNYGVFGKTAGEGKFYGTIGVAGWADNEQIDVSGGSTNVALVNGAEINGASFTGALVNEPVNGTGSPISISGLLNYDAGTEDVPIDSEILAGVQASGTLTATGQPANNDTVTIGATTYTFKTALTPAANEVLIGATTEDSLRNLAWAVNEFGGAEGINYGDGTVINASAEAYVSSATTLVATAKKPNDNTIASTELSATLSWGGATLTGGSGNTGAALNHGRRATDATATGTYRINDIVGSFADNDTGYIDGVLNYDNVVAGQKFKVGQKVRGAISEAEGRIVAVTATRLLLVEQKGRFEDNEQLDVKAVDGTLTNTALANGTDTTVAAFTVNHPNGRQCPITEQLKDLQGGIYSNSINNVRHSRRFYNSNQDFFDEVENLSTPPPLQGNTKNAKYTIINSWFIPDLSFRFLDSGGFTDLAGDNVWQNPQALGGQRAITASGFGAPAIQPDQYIEFDGVEVPQFWLEGNIDIILKVKTNTSIEDATATAGEGGVIATTMTVFNRFYGHTYSHFQTQAFVEPEAQVVTIALNTLDDGNNKTGVYTIAYDAGTGAWNVGERIQTVGAGLPDKVGVVVSADSTLTGTITYVLKSPTQFTDNDVITGVFSQVSKTVNEPGGLDATNDLVQGYLLDLGFAHIDAHYTGGTTSGTFQVGEGVTQTGTGAVGVFAEDDTNDIYIGELNATAVPWNATGTITGDESGATYTPTTRTAIGTAPKDVGDESDNNYGCVFGLNKRAGTALTVQQAYEAMKLLTAKENTSEQGGRNNTTTVQGKFYLAVDASDASPTFTEVPGSPYGLKPGTVLNLSQSVFIQDMASADIQNYTQIDESGAVDNPPNVRSYTVTGLSPGVRFSAFRSTGSGNTAILTTEYTVGTVGGGNNQAADSTILVAAGTRGVSPLNNDVPTSGFLSVEKPGVPGEFLTFEYASRNKTTNVFTLAVTPTQPTGTIADITGAGVDLVATDNVFVHIFTKVATGSVESTNITYDSVDIPTVLEARLKGFAPFQGTVDFIGTANTTIAAVLGDDTAVDP